MEIKKVIHNGVQIELLVGKSTFVRFYQIPEGYWYYQKIGVDPHFQSTISPETRETFLARFGVKE